MSKFFWWALADVLGLVYVYALAIVMFVITITSFFLGHNEVILDFNSFHERTWEALVLIFLAPFGIRRFVIDMSRTWEVNKWWKKQKEK